MRAVRALFANLWGNSNGAVLPIAAAGMLLAAVIVGSAIDISRDFKVTNQIQSACDAAVLAGRRTVTTAGLDTASITAAKNYFNTNFDETAQGARSTTFTVTSDDGGKTVNGVATATLDTLVMRLFGNKSFQISVKCASSMGVGNADVMMVLDNTGSMTTSLGSTTRIAALRQSMKDFYTTLSNATASSNARIRYGFVPYSSTVNVGRLLYALNPAYLTDKYTYQTRVAVYKTSTTTNSTTSATTSTSWETTATYTRSSDCTSAKPSDDAAFSNYGPSTTTTTTTTGQGGQTVTTVVAQPQRRNYYRCLQSGPNYYLQKRHDDRTLYTTTETAPAFNNWNYQPLEMDTSVFKTFASITTPTGASGSNVSSTWDGCIHERTTTAASTFSYDSSISRIRPTTALDVDIDTAPTTDNSTRWAPLWPQITYLRYDSSGEYSVAASTRGSSDHVTEYCPRLDERVQRPRD